MNPRLDIHTARFGVILGGGVHCLLGGVDRSGRLRVCQRMIAAYCEPNRTRGRELMSTLTGSVSQGAPKALSEVVMLGGTLDKRAADVLACFDRPGTQQRTGRGDQRPPRAPARPPGPQPHQLHRQEPARDRRVQAATTPCPRYAAEGGDARGQLRASDPATAGAGETPQLTLNLNPGDNCFAVCGEALCPASVPAELVPERCRRARSKEVSPIFVHSRVLTLSRWSR